MYWNGPMSKDVPTFVVGQEGVSYRGRHVEVLKVGADHGKPGKYLVRKMESEGVKMAAIWVTGDSLAGESHRRCKNCDAAFVVPHTSKARTCEDCRNAPMGSPTPPLAYDIAGEGD